MKRLYYSPPDEFSTSPLLALLPVCGQVTKLETLVSSLYARYERVSGIRKELQSVSESADEMRRFAAEENMLRQALEWLSVSLDEGSGAR